MWDCFPQVILYFFSLPVIVHSHCAIIYRRDIDIESLLFIGEIVQLSENGAKSRFYSGQEVNETDLRLRCLDEQESLCMGQLSPSSSNNETTNGYSQFNILFMKKPWTISQEISVPSNLRKNVSYCFCVTIFRAYTLAVDDMDANFVKPVRVSKLMHMGKFNSPGFNVLSSFHIGRNKTISDSTAISESQSPQRTMKKYPTSNEKRKNETKDESIMVSKNVNSHPVLYDEIGGQLYDSKAQVSILANDKQIEEKRSPSKRRNSSSDISLASYKISKQNYGQFPRTFEDLHDNSSPFSCQFMTDEEEITQDTPEKSSLSTGQSPATYSNLNWGYSDLYGMSPFQTPIQKQENFESWENMQREWRSPLFNFTNDDCILFNNIDDAIITANE